MDNTTVMSQRCFTGRCQAGSALPLALWRWAARTRIFSLVLSVSSLFFKRSAAIRPLYSKKHGGAKELRAQASNNSGSHLSHLLRSHYV